MSGEDRRGSKRELAAALIIQHGIVLFRDTEVRKLVGRKCRAAPPGRWHPGKGGALTFVVEVRFPPQFAGITASALAQKSTLAALCGRLQGRSSRSAEAVVAKTGLDSLLLYVAEFR
jgi:hypothetical protein